MYQITIPGQPQGKARAKVYANKYTGKAHGVTPEKTVNYENLIKTIFIQKYGQPVNLSPLSIYITAYYEIPKSTSNKKSQMMAEGAIRPTTKPDIDNVSKCVADALNKIAYKDDSQIVNLNASKFYSNCPRVTVEIKEAKE